MCLLTPLFLSLMHLCFSPARFNFENGTPSTNFDTFPAAIMTVFQVRRKVVGSRERGRGQLGEDYNLSNNGLKRICI